MSRTLAAAATLTVFAVGCSGSAPTLPPTRVLSSTGPASASYGQSEARSAKPTETLYAFSPVAKPVVASYSLPNSGHISPRSTITGSRTRLVAGHYVGAIAVLGTKVYVLDGVHSQLLTFPIGAVGNVAPASIAILPSGLYHGLALDKYGNFWTAEWDTATMQRFPLSGHGLLKPSLIVTPKLETPIGMLQAAPVTVATRGSDLYCLCSALHEGAQAIGVTEYRFIASGHHRLIKSYYDQLGPPLPELPPSMMRVDRLSGDVYAAGVLSYHGVFAWSGNQKSGAVRKRRTIYGPATKLENIESLTTDSQGNLYVATPYGIEIFGPKANGDVTPNAQMTDPNHLKYRQGQSGNFITIDR